MLVHMAGEEQHATSHAHAANTAQFAAIEVSVLSTNQEKQQRVPARRVLEVRRAQSPVLVRIKLEFHVLEMESVYSTK